MNCIIVDDEPLAREAMKLLIEESDNLQLIGSFNSAAMLPVGNMPWYVLPRSAF